MRLWVKNKIDFIFDEIVNIKCFCACHVPYFSLIRKIVVQRVTSIWAFTLNALNPFWYVHPPPLTINVNRCLHQFLWMREKERKFFLQFLFQNIFLLKIHYLFKAKNREDWSCSLELNTSFNLVNLKCKSSRFEINTIFRFNG